MPSLELARADPKVVEKRYHSAWDDWKSVQSSGLSLSLIKVKKTSSSGVFAYMT